ncbi:hypothetical protein ANANG_G00006270 [Anguilla anguilla]|uniref:TNFR-Cys domain-containing protein n=1 Tax=Anguilla anguilla TaxID=7936 RepID=A0A9D3SAT7_ANGAN|nr:hypothetical protein ANANG_G00006270 [Anguilla anguilla]
MTTELPCSKDEFRHENRCCKGCPKGQYVDSPCQGSEQTVCLPCSRGHFLNDTNFLRKCQLCRSCHSSSHMVLVGECMPDQDRRCKCEEGYYCEDDRCEHCRPLSACAIGSGVSTPSNGRMNTVCEPCPEGKYSNVTDSKTPCLPHTQCEVLGMRTRTPGTESSDAVCAAREPARCDWALPACLWAGLILTVLIIGFGYFFRRAKRRSKMKVSRLELPVNDVVLNLPNLIPEVYNQLYDEESHALNCNGRHIDSDFASTVLATSCQVEVHHPMKSVDLECDGPGKMPPLTSSDHFNQSAIRTGGMKIFTPSPCQSQPQEDEWSGT